MSRCWTWHISMLTKASGFSANMTTKCHIKTMREEEVGANMISS